MTKTPVVVAVDQQILVALTKVLEGQTEIVRLLQQILTEATRPVGEDASIKRLESKITRLIDLLSRSVAIKP